MTILDTSVTVDRAKSKKPINEDITAVTLVEFPRIVYYKLFSGRVIFPIRHDFILAHRLQLGLLELGKPSGSLRPIGRLNSHKQRWGTNYKGPRP